MKTRSRLTALLLALVMALGTAAPALATTIDLAMYQQLVNDAQVEPVIDEGGEVYDFGGTAVEAASGYDVTSEVTLAVGDGEQDVALPVNGKLLLTSAIENGQWQVQVGDMWVNMHGETGSTLEVTYAKVQSLFAMNNAAKLRFISADGSAVSNVANVGLDYSVQTLEEDVAMPMMFAARRSVDGNAGIALAAEGDASSDEIQVIIEYKRGTGADAVEVAEPYIAKLGKDGGDLTTSVIQLPVVKGYVASYVTPTTGVKFTAPTANSNGTIQLSLEDVTETARYMVVYEPAEVEFKVNHMLMGFDGVLKNAELDKTTKHTGLTNSPVGGGLALDEEYPGFYSLWYDETTKIAADGSTVVNVYYERNWYLMLFDLDGGYGVEPIYAQYGADIDVDESKLNKPGYTFEGWSATSNGTVDAALPPEKMPAENVTYYAVWKPVDLAKVSVVIWGENADDEGYSYIKSSEFYAMPGSNVTYETGNMVCGHTEHTHTEACYKCGQTAHEHSADCCTIEAHTHSEECCVLEVHEHSRSCYRNVGQAASPNNAPTSTAVNGQIYQPYYTNQRYIYIAGVWYVYNGNFVNNGTVIGAICGEVEESHEDHTCVYCDREEHVHNDTDCEYCNIAEHKHTQACLSCTQKEHVHTDSCYITNPAMDSKLWRYVRSDEITVAADGSSVMNVYFDRVEYTLTFKDGYRTVYTIQEKWGSNISAHWPIKGTNGTTYNNGERWDPSGTNTYTEVLVHINVMPAESFDLSVDSGAGKDRYTMHYMVEVLPGESGTTYNNRVFEEAFVVNARYNFVTEAEDFFDLDGFTQWASNPNFRNNEIDTNGGDVYFYYTRNRYDLVLNNGEDNVYVFTSDTKNADYDNRNGEGVLYEANLGSYEQYIPTLPSFYEENSHSFAGWYLNPECTGEQIILSNEMMPAENVILYAKWEPVVHTVTVNIDLTSIGENPITVVENIPHRSTVPEGSFPTNEELEALAAANGYGAYSFVGWFYQDTVTNADGTTSTVEKAFDPDTMPVIKNLDIYARWSATEAIPFTFYYKTKDDQGNEVEVAAPYQSKALEGASITVEAKTGSDLLAGYREGYFPNPPSHTLEITVDATKEFTFWYTPANEVPYRVVHVEVDQFPDENGQNFTVREVLKEETFADNRATIVTATYERFEGLRPDGVQKRLVVSYPGTTADNGNYWADSNLDTPENIIFFYYIEDTVNAMWSVEHFVEPVGGADDLADWIAWTDPMSYPGVIGKEQIATALTLDGFTYHAGYVDAYTVGEEQPNTENVTEELKYTLTNGGMGFRLYYTRNEYPVKVQYLENGTNKELAPEELYAVTVDGEEVYTFDYQDRVEVTKNKVIDGYTLISPVTQTHSVVIEDTADITDLDTITANVVSYFYKETEVPIHYQVVGPDGCGTVELIDEDEATTAGRTASEEVPVFTGTAVGAEAKTASNVYKFVGWYSDEDCENLISTEATYEPQQPRHVDETTGAPVLDKWQEATYYAMFEYNLTSLTITKTGHQSIDPNQTFIFKVTGEGLGDGIMVSIDGDGSKTISGLTVGVEYTVTEMEDWSWRYDSDSSKKITLQPSGNTVTINNTRKHIYWLDGNAVSNENVYGE